MLKIVAVLAAMLFATAAAAQGVYHGGYYNNRGTYVAPHYQSAPNSSTYDNWSTRGNINPYTGQPGTRNPYPSNGSYYGQ